MLNLKGIGEYELIEMESERVNIKIFSNEGIFELKNINTVGNLSLLRQTLTMGVIRRFRNANKLNVEPHTDVIPRLLIGQDNCSLIVSRETQVVKSSSLSTSRTYLGWVIHGPTDGNIPTPRTMNNNVSYTAKMTDKTKSQGCTLEDESLHVLVKEYFNIESLGVRERSQIT